MCRQLSISEVGDVNLWEYTNEQLMETRTNSYLVSKAALRLSFSTLSRPHGYQ